MISKAIGNDKAEVQRKERSHQDFMMTVRHTQNWGASSSNRSRRMYPLPSWRHTLQAEHNIVSFRPAQPVDQQAKKDYTIAVKTASMGSAQIVPIWTITHVTTHKPPQQKQRLTRTSGRMLSSQLQEHLLQRSGNQISARLVDQRTKNNCIIVAKIANMVNVKDAQTRIPRNASTEMRAHWERKRQVKNIRCLNQR